jgi:hypothetical protein
MPLMNRPAHYPRLHIRVELPVDPSDPTEGYAMLATLVHACRLGFGRFHIRRAPEHDDTRQCWVVTCP